VSGKRQAPAAIDATNIERADASQRRRFDGKIIGEIMKAVVQQAVPRRHGLALALALAFAGEAAALPQQGRIVAGAGAIASGPTAMTVRQDTPKMTLHWQKFGVGAGESLRFMQPSSSAIVLNRVLGQDGSRIMGSVQANGQVFISNPNGVLFGPGARVDAAGLVATTGALSDADFDAGVFRFSGNGAPASVVNQGVLTAADRGYIALLAPKVVNEGVIGARLGATLLGAGDDVTLNLENGSLLGYRINRGALDALADNRQLIKADGGRVFMGADAVNALARAVVNNDGLIEALTVGEDQGMVSLIGDKRYGVISGGGKIDASAPNGGDGGFVETSAAHVVLSPRAEVTTAAPSGKVGKWLIDPVDYILGDGGQITTDEQLQNALANNSLEIQADRNITVNKKFRPVFGSAPKSLTLSAGNDITITGGFEVTGFALISMVFNAGNDIILDNQAELKTVQRLSGNTVGSLILRAGMSTATGTLKTGPARPTGYININGGVQIITNETSYANPTDYSSVIQSDPRVNPDYSLLRSFWVSTPAQLQAMNTNLTTSYVLKNDIRFPARVPGQQSFTPVGTRGNPFVGLFEGNGHTISGLNIEVGAGNESVGLFGTARARFIRNVGLTGARIVNGGEGATGALIGETIVGTNVSNVFVDATSTVEGRGNTGGVIGIHSGVLEKSYNDARVNGRDHTGGVVGWNFGAVRSSYNTGNIAGASRVGGVTGMNDEGGTLETTYNSGAVSGATLVGGVVGENTNLVREAYSTAASVTASAPGASAGGLFGEVANNGRQQGLLFWDRQKSGIVNSCGCSYPAPGRALDTAATMKFYTGDLAGGDWAIYLDRTTPLIAGLLKPATAVYAADSSRAYDGVAGTGIETLRRSISYIVNGRIDPAAATSPNIFYALKDPVVVKDVGDYALTPQIWSNQKGYLITQPAAGQAIKLTITRRPVNLVPTAIQKEYDGTTATTGAVRGSNLVAGHTVRATQSLDRADANTATAGDMRTLNVDPGFSIWNGTENVTKNYFIQPIPLKNASIQVTPRPLQVTANDVTRIFDDIAFSGGNGITVSGFVAGEGMDVVRGTVSYGGTAQGAKQVGRYTIVPRGLAARNYRITFDSGALRIDAPVVPPVSPDKPSAAPASPASRPLLEAMEDGSTDLARSDDAGVPAIDRQASAFTAAAASKIGAAAGMADSLLQVTGGGARLPAYVK
jgi:filamentous hemagglutinin family protein